MIAALHVLTRSTPLPAALKMLVKKALVLPRTEPARTGSARRAQLLYCLAGLAATEGSKRKEVGAALAPL